MNAQDLRKSILQLAVQGQLVEQRPEEGTAQELRGQIRAEKQRLIKEKKIKKEQPLPEIAEDEIPFEIPVSWEWVRLGSILSIESGKGLTAKQMVQGTVPVYGGNGITGYHNQSLVHKETVVIGRVGFYCGSVHVTQKEAWITDNAFIVTYLKKKMENIHVLVMMNGVVGNNNRRKLNIKEFRAFTLVNKYVPLIFINTCDSETGKLFSILQNGMADAKTSPRHCRGLVCC